MQIPRDQSTKNKIGLEPTQLAPASPANEDGQDLSYKAEDGHPAMVNYEQTEGADQG
jgi:hypothetical protein